MTTEQEIKLIGFNKFNVLDKIQTIIPDFQITGSLSLLVHNIIDRPVGDIDLVIEDFYQLKAFEKFNIDVEYSHDYDFERPKKKIHQFNKNLNSLSKEVKLPNRAFTKINGVKVCFFIRKDLKHTIYEFTTGYRVFKITDPKYTIESKIKYIKKYNELELDKPLESYQLAIREKHLKGLPAFSAFKIPKSNDIWVSH